MEANGSEGAAGDQESEEDVSTRDAEMSHEIKWKTNANSYS